MRRAPTRRHHIGPGLLVGLAVAGFGAAIVLITLTALVVSGWASLEHFDRRLSARSVEAMHHHPVLLTLARVTTDLGNPGTVTVICVVGVASLLVRRRWTGALVLAVAPSITSLIGQVMKRSVGRPRPHVVDPVAHAAGLSFPSGHSSGIACLATLGIVAVAMTGRTPAVRRRVPWWVCGMLVLGAVAVAASRVLLGVHYPSDVVGGLSLGMLVGSTTVLAAVAVTGRARRVGQETGDGRER